MLYIQSQIDKNRNGNGQEHNGQESSDTESVKPARSGMQQNVRMLTLSVFFR